MKKKLVYMLLMPWAVFDVPFIRVATLPYGRDFLFYTNSSDTHGLTCLGHQILEDAS